MVESRCSLACRHVSAHGEGVAPKEGDAFADLVGEEKFHDARRGVEESGENLQGPQQDVHGLPRAAVRFRTLIRVASAIGSCEQER